MDNLDLINSDWFIRMLKKSSNKPQARLLSLFDILEDWLDAPYAQQPVASTSHSTLPTNHHLQDFLAIEATKAGAALPEMLASQLYFMAVAAAQEKLQTNNQLSLSHAKNAASALIAAQTEKEFRIAKTSAYAIAASFLGALIVTGSLFIHNKTDLPSSQQVAQTTPYTAVNASQIASPQQTAALLAQLDQMRKGNCQLIEAIQLPDSSKKVYFENVVLGQISTNIEDQKLVQHLLDMVRCNYTPMLMANSKG
ncbi:hypothetical protein [Methylotenera versatilis]|uniref:hypothetical protein n=1 Tax=Methylotenera versatilis TaxID=1055487 RepID=UPI000646666E|nr:hypothetical protein [Methylotenera versatilis]